jgi:hypothetical protein
MGMLLLYFMAKDVPKKFFWTFKMFHAGNILIKI